MDSKEVAFHQLLAVHKVAHTLSPLLEVISSNQRLNAVDHFNLVDAFGDIAKNSQKLLKIYSDNAGFELKPEDVIVDKLMAVLSQALANEILLYNNPSIDMFSSIFGEVISKNAEVIHQKTEKVLGDDYQNDKFALAQNVAYVMDGVSQLFSSVWFFNNNLYISGLLSHDSMVELTLSVNETLTDVVFKMMDNVQNDNKFAAHLSLSTFSLCCKSVSFAMSQFQSRLIKNKNDVSAYIEEPSKYIEQMLPLFISNFSVMNDSAKSVIERLGIGK
jgi:hypothetical protein